MPETLVTTIIGALVTVILTMAATVAAVVTFLNKRLPSTTGTGGNGYAKNTEISGLHEKINKHADNQNNHCAAQLARCNEQFTMIRTNQASFGTEIQYIKASVTRIETAVNKNNSPNNS